MGTTNNTQNLVRRSGSGPIVFGIASLITCLFPFVGLPVSVAGLCVSARRSNAVGMVLCVFGLFLAVANVGFGSAKIMERMKNEEKAAREAELRNRVEWVQKNAGRIAEDFLYGKK